MGGGVKEMVVVGFWINGFGIFWDGAGAGEFFVGAIFGCGFVGDITWGKFNFGIGAEGVARWGDAGFFFELEITSIDSVFWVFDDNIIICIVFVGYEEPHVWRLGNGFGFGSYAVIFVV